MPLLSRLRPRSAAPLNRPDDPVVITGAGVPSLSGAAPGQVVAFAWSGSWDQIPVQVDERKPYDLRVAYPTPFALQRRALLRPFSTPAKLRYADAGTRVGADTNPTLDADDEIAFMARDAGAAGRRGGRSRPAWSQARAWRSR